jgi:hypothetical protein
MCLATADRSRRASSNHSICQQRMGIVYRNLVEASRLQLKSRVRVGRDIRMRGTLVSRNPLAVEFLPPYI